MEKRLAGLTQRYVVPFLSYLIFTLTPAPADPNKRLLPPQALQPHPRITLRRSDYPRHVLSRKSMGKHWGCRALSDVVGIGETATLKLAQVSMKSLKCEFDWIVGKYDVLRSIVRVSFLISSTIHPHKAEH